MAHYYKFFVPHHTNLSNLPPSYAKFSLFHSSIKCKIFIILTNLCSVHSTSEVLFSLCQQLFMQWRICHVIDSSNNLPWLGIGTNFVLFQFFYTYAFYSYAFCLYLFMYFVCIVFTVFYGSLCYLLLLKWSIYFLVTLDHISF